MRTAITSAELLARRRAEPVVVPRHAPAGPGPSTWERRAIRRAAATIRSAASAGSKRRPTARSAASAADGLSLGARGAGAARNHRAARSVDRPAEQLQRQGAGAGRRRTAAWARTERSTSPATSASGSGTLSTAGRRWILGGSLERSRLHVQRAVLAAARGSVAGERLPLHQHRGRRRGAGVRCSSRSRSRRRTTAAPGRCRTKRSICSPGSSPTFRSTGAAEVAQRESTRRAGRSGSG